jgi:hypothetical protein
MGANVRLWVLCTAIGLYVIGHETLGSESSRDGMGPVQGGELGAECDEALSGDRVYCGIDALGELWTQ